VAPEPGEQIGEAGLFGAAQAAHDLRDPLVVEVASTFESLAAGAGEGDAADPAVAFIVALGDQAGPGHAVERGTEAGRVDEEGRAQLVHAWLGFAALLEAR
jgi:hypothetical protein